MTVREFFSYCSEASNHIPARTSPAYGDGPSSETDARRDGRRFELHHRTRRNVGQTDGSSAASDRVAA